MINPILERELKTRMRTWKTVVLLCGYLAIIGLIVWFTFLTQNTNYGYGYSGFNPSNVTTVYTVITMFQLGLLLSILPVFTATSISGERERQTLDLLLCTNISPWKIIFGKVSAALSFVLLLVIAAMPFMGIILLFGGVTVLDILKVILFYMVTAVMVSSIGMFCTTHFKKNLTSIVMSYIILGLIFFIPLFTFGVFMIFMNSMSSGTQAFATFVEKYAYEIVMLLFASNPFYGISSLLQIDSFSSIFYSLGGMSTTSLTWLRYVSPWMATTISYVITTSVFLYLAKRKLIQLK